MSTQIQIASSGGVPSGFKYNIQPVFYGSGSNIPAPTAGQATYGFQADGEGGYYDLGWYFHKTDANGIDASAYLQRLGGQPFLIDTSAGKSIWTGPNGTYASNVWNISNLAADGLKYGLNQTQLENTVGYFNFGTSNVPVNYNGYTIHGHLNGTTIPVGTSFIAPGSSTTGVSISSRYAYLTQVANGYITSWIQTAGTMTGTMVVATYVNGSASYGALTIPTGSAAGIYTVLNNVYIGQSQFQLGLGITQTTATSAGILGFGFKMY